MSYNKCLISNSGSIIFWEPSKQYHNHLSDYEKERDDLNSNELKQIPNVHISM